MLSLDADPVVGALDPERVNDGRAVPAWRVLGRLEKTAIGARGGHGVTTVRRREPAGCLLYGPYWQLRAGTYRLNFRCRSGGPRISGQPVLGVEVIAMNRVQLAWLDLTAEELRAEVGSLEFSVPAPLGLGAGDEARLEFRFFHMGNADLTITAVDLYGTEMAEPRPDPARVWRMLGRLEKTAIGKRTGEGVTVRQADRAGCVLDGGRPFLQLPRGRYRLSFECRAGIPRMASQPVLGVEVVARRRWRDGRSWSWGSLLGLPARGGVQQAWRDFTAPQLRCGSGSVDFTVPAELSLEGGQEVVFGFRFVHLGNADLTIGSVDLRQASEEEAVSTPPREWRLLGRLAKGTIGTREADCVSVRRDEPPNTLLYGGRPNLQLPGGQYRLSFCCGAGAPRLPSEPVLSVEVIARKRSLLGRSSFLQARHNFTSGALQAESGSVDFDVPAELGREREENISFEFRFLHLGNADLAISAVNLREADRAEASLHDTGVVAVPRPRSPAIIAPKTNVIIVGNCQAQTVYEALIRTRAFNARLDVKYHFVGLQQDLHDLGRSELKKCNILLVQYINDWKNYPLRPDIRDDLPIIKFPLLHFASLWPFDHYNGPGDREAYERESPNLTFLYLDGLLARLRKEIPDRNQRLLAYRSLSLDGVINYVRLHDFEKRRLLAMDKQFGFDIGQFILDHFQKKRLFYTTNHPNWQIFAMLMQHLLKHLGIVEVYRPIASLDHLKRLQVPVHPKVAEALGVKWASENTKYLYGGEHITWETYVRRYIEHYG
jgi:Polysaccharide biosynthesis enzyme WcbI